MSFAFLGAKSWHQRIEPVILFIASGLISGLVFLDWGDGNTNPYLHGIVAHSTQTNLLYFFLVWSAVHQNMAVTVKLIFLVTMVAMTSAILGTGPYADEEFQLVVFIASFLVIGIALGHHVERNRKLHARLAAKEAIASRSLQNYIDALNEHAIVSATNATGEIVAVNSKFCAISGYSKEELIGQDHRILNSGYHPHSFFFAMYQRLAEGRPWHGEIRNRTKDGRHYWVKSTIIRFKNEEGDPIHYISIRTDITAQKETEIELDRISAELAVSYRKLDAEHQDLKKLKAESDHMHRQLLQCEKMAAVGHLAAGMAHEINNPIGFVNSNLGTLNRYVDELMRFVDLGTATPAGQRLAVELDLNFIRSDIPTLVDESQAGIERVRKIVAALKDFSHVGEVEWQRTDLLLGLRNAIDVAANEIRYKAQVVDNLVPLPFVLCIPGRINQVFLNLLVNAAQAIESAGTITLRSGVDADGTVAWVEIVDTGCGMDEVTRQQLFDPFFTTKPVGTGTGLGLTSSWDIVQQHGGAIDVTSTPGHGSCFRVTLPIDGPDLEANQS